MNPSSHAATLFEGRPVASLTPAEITALVERCAIHRAKLAAKGLTQNAAHAAVCAAADYYHSGAGQSIAAAFARFSALRQAAMKCGYVPPPIHGTPAPGDIERVNNALQEAIRAAEPLPGEDPALTARITHEARAAVAAVIAEVNGFPAPPPPPVIDAAQLTIDIARAARRNPPQEVHG